MQFLYNDAVAIARSGAVLSAAFIGPAAIASLFDARTLNDVSVWAKPLKFAVSFFVHQLTLVWLLGLLPREVQERRLVRGAVLAGTASVAVELLYITLQAARGRHSHFNMETPMEAFLYFGVMGTGAVVIVAAAFVVGAMLWRHALTGPGSGLRLGAAAGLMLGAAATLIVASVLSSGAIAGPGHWVGGERSDAGGLLFTGWSRSGGDLRVPHFFATHLMQALPVLGLVADRLAPAHTRAIIAAGAIAGVLVVAGTFVQAARGLPLL